LLAAGSFWTLLVPLCRYSMAWELGCMAAHSTFVTREEQPNSISHERHQMLICVLRKQ
jgi:hypothetical protein